MSLAQTVSCTRHLSYFNHKARLVANGYLLFVSYENAIYSQLPSVESMHVQKFYESREFSLATVIICSVP